MDAVINFILSYFKRIFSSSPLLITIESYSYDKVLVRNISQQNITVVKNKPKEALLYFQPNIILEPNELKYLYLSDEFSAKKTAQLTLIVKEQSGSKHKVKINWNNNKPLIKS